MDRNPASRRLLIVAGHLAACAASLVLIAVPAQADQLDQHNDLVNQFVTQMHADPLVADCAAHGDFVASTSTMLDHVEFPPSSFDSAHASVTPWNDSFDEGKQRVKVDTIVTVDGIGIAKENSNAPYDLKFRCGYVGQQMLAFSWNDPVPPARARSERGTASQGSPHVKGKHSTKKATGKHSKDATSSRSGHKSSSSGTKSTTQSAAKKTTAKSTAKKTTSKKKSTTAH